MNQQIKPVILAICGKSAVGKDTLAKQLVYEFKNRNIFSNYIVSDTTRFPRANERDGIDYNFISNVEFARNKIQKQYLECSTFRGGHYGTSKNSIDPYAFNIGVFNPDGIRSLRRYREHFLTIPIYLDEDIIIRMKRSYQREAKGKLEFFRRVITDGKDFKKINHLLNFFQYYIILQDERTVSTKINKIMGMLEEGGFIAAGQNPIKYTF